MAAKVNDMCRLLQNEERTEERERRCAVLATNQKIKKQKVCSACVVLKLQETTAIGVAIQSGVTRWVPGRWPCCRRRSTCALGRSGGGSGGSRRRRGLAAKDLLQAGAASMRTCDPHSPPHTYPAQKSNFCKQIKYRRSKPPQSLLLKQAISGGYLSMIFFKKFLYFGP